MVIDFVVIAMKKTVLAIQPLLEKEMKQLESGYNVIRLWDANDPVAMQMITR